MPKKPKIERVAIYSQEPVAWSCGGKNFPYNRRMAEVYEQDNECGCDRVK